jgi:acyl-CoA thioesterase-1
MKESTYLGLSQVKPRFGMAKRTLCTLFTLVCFALPVSADKVLVLGDSLSAGYGMAMDQAWPALLQERLQQEPEYADWQVVNASISGETSEGGVRRLPALLKEFQPDWVLLELGANDGLRGYPVAAISANLGRMVTMSQQSGAQVAVLGIQIPPNYGARYTKPFFAQYAMVAKQYDTQLVPFILEDVAINTELMQDDGLHPTIEAQPLLLNNVWQHIRWQ